MAWSVQSAALCLAHESEIIINEFVVLSHPVYASAWFAYECIRTLILYVATFGFSLSHCPWPQNLYLSRMKSQEGNLGYCWLLMSLGRKNGFIWRQHCCKWQQPRQCWILSTLYLAYMKHTRRTAWASQKAERFLESKLVNHCKLAPGNWKHWPCHNSAYASPNSLNKKLKNVSCECIRSNGGNSTLQAAWYIRRVRLIWFLWTKPTGIRLDLVEISKKARNCQLFVTVGLNLYYS